MKIWITRDIGGSLQGGGLERCWVWFRKPEWVDRWASYSETPFGWFGEKYGGRDHGWEFNGYGLHPISFGKLFGYQDHQPEDCGENKLADHVWKELHRHFKCPFKEWDQSKAKTKDFLLELEINISFNV